MKYEDLRPGDTFGLRTERNHFRRIVGIWPEGLSYEYIGWKVFSMSAWEMRSEVLNSSRWTVKRPIPGYARLPDGL